MGGLALQHLGVKRIDAQTYTTVSNYVIVAFSKLFDELPAIIPSYAEKADFGDCDMLVVGADLPEDWRKRLAEWFNSKGWVTNGDVTSMEVQNIQFDFISVKAAQRHSSYVYFAYNDLGNLMGRVAHKMGFKYGPFGLQKVLRDGTHEYATVQGPFDPEAVFAFMGYSYERWRQGFDTLEDIFKFAASTPYFHPDVFLLHNRNAKSRIRDSKRKSYTEFLKWCSTTPGLTHYPWSLELAPKLEQHQEHLERACAMWPSFAWDIKRTGHLKQERDALKKIWNGSNVSQWSGLVGKNLGILMSVTKNHPDFEAACIGENAEEKLKALVQEEMTHLDWDVINGSLKEFF